MPTLELEDRWASIPWRPRRSQAGRIRIVFSALAALALIFYIFSIKLPRRINVNKHVPSSSAKFRFELEGEWDPTPMQEVCSQIKWRKGLYFSCHDNSGGVGNIRSFLLNCIRYAIQAGGSILVPTIRVRDPNDINHLFTHNETLSYFFDESFFKDSLAVGCPQLRVFDDEDAIPHSDNFRTLQMNPKEAANQGQTDGSGIADVNHYVSSWQEDLSYFLSARNIPISDDDKNPLIINFRWPTFFEWPVMVDGIRFANTFGRILKFNPSIISIAEQVITSMHEKYPSSSKSTHEGLFNFFGVHLRTEYDSLPWWPDAQTQEDQAIARIEAFNAEVIYVATTDMDSYERVKSRFKGSTTRKAELLSGGALKSLQGMTWDQQGMVDYLVLLTCFQFIGISTSSFAMNLAARRHLLDNGIDTQLWRGVNDSRSFLHGPRASYRRNWVFFIEEAMWP